MLFGTDSMETKSFLESGIIQKVFTEAQKWQKHIFREIIVLEGGIKLEKRPPIFMSINPMLFVIHTPYLL